MTLLTIQDWIQSDYFKSHNKPTTNPNSLDRTLHYSPRYYHLPTDIRKYSPSIQDMKKPNELQSYHEFEQYCKRLLNEIKHNKVMHQSPLVLDTLILDEFNSLVKTDSEKLLEYYLDYIKRGDSQWI